MAIPGNPKGLAKDIAEGYFALTPPILRKFTPPELKTINQNLNIVLRETRGEGVETGDVETIRRKSLRLQRLNQALLVLSNYCKQNRVPL
ncbi:MAG: hypothetical protein HYY89_04000 [candidate division NC10 bacterium]|nr:hypothetical protein [candidate division NC10 bacterium]